ncbi:MAG TPA: DUF2264 domain-containing protein [Verrucomicrobiae bacterium]|jgi:hypothetical protein|nr:DUF2264 domain-containing protein [Verrucomicrobiae bacterium]
MSTRREFLKSAALLGLAGATVPHAVAQTRDAVHGSMNAGGAATGAPTDRAYWLDVMQRIARPVLENLSQRKLKQVMPVEAANPADRRKYTHLEAFGRLTAGIAPWLAAQGLDDSETQLKKKFSSLVQASLDAATNPASPDFMNFTRGGQPLVDAAFLAQGIMRAPSVLWEPLDPLVQAQIVAALKSSRAIKTPTGNNWVMFAAMVEVALHKMGEITIQERLQDCVRHMLGWYKGDGAYGDGEPFHWDYYNSFVIHPMLLDTLAILREMDPATYEPLHQTELKRARRYAEIQERLIAPDGTFPSLGRSTTYRFGALQSLAQIALMRELPEHVIPAQARCAMTAVIRRMIEAPDTFDSHGWLQIGFCGHQPSLAETYISTGSLYLCSAALLPLGLPPSNEFWTSPATQWTSQRLWSGQSLPADHAITG